MRRVLGREDVRRRRRRSVMGGGLARQMGYLGVLAMDSRVRIGLVVLRELLEKCCFFMDVAAHFDPSHARV